MKYPYKDLLNDKEHKFFKIFEGRVVDISLNLKFKHKESIEELKTAFPMIMPIDKESYTKGKYSYGHPF
jgi:lipoate-protein ligase A